MAFENAFGTNLAAARTKAGYSVETAARMLDVKPKVIEAWERGKAVPTDEELMLLSKLYSVDLSVLTAEGNGTEPPNPREEDSDVPPKQEARSEFSAPHTQDEQTSPFSEYLEDGEEILWEGRPAPRWKYGKKFKARLLSALAPIPVFLLLTAAAEIEPRAFPFILVVFLCYAVYLEGITLVLCLGTQYAVTTRRILIRSAIPYLQCREYRYEDPYYPRIYTERDGYGSLFFSSSDLHSAREANRESAETESYGEFRINRHRRNGWVMPPNPTKNLVGIANVEELYCLVARQFAEAHPLDKEDRSSGSDT